MQRSTVDLPEPLGPMTTSTLPCATVKLTLLTAQQRTEPLVQILDHNHILYLQFHEVPLIPIPKRPARFSGSAQQTNFR